MFLGGEEPINAQFGQISLLSGVLVVGFVPVALATGQGPDVVATITSIAKKTGRVTLQTDTGEVFHHAKRAEWKVGDKVICYRNKSARSPRLSDCRPWS